MIGCSDTRISQLTFSLTQCWSGLSHVVGTLVCKFTHTGTHGVKHILRFLCSFCTRSTKTLIMDGVKEQVMGEFGRKARQADCQVKQTEPYSPWQNAAEATIKELKKGTGRKMIRTGSPHVLWDDCLELEAEI